jgi:polyisoprenoid-binding protein YceI
MKLFLGLVISLAMGTSALAATETWEVDSAHSTAAFKIRHMMVSWVHGTLSGIAGTVTMNEKGEPKSMAADVTIDAKSINTNNADRDKHLRSADFFNTEAHPTITFKTKKVTGGNTFKLVGDLTMNGKTKEVTFEGKDLTKPVKDMQGGVKRGFTATTKLNRKDFGINWNKNLDAGGLAVGDDVDVTVDLELNQKQATKS